MSWFSKPMWFRKRMEDVDYAVTVDLSRQLIEFKIDTEMDLTLTLTHARAVRLRAELDTSSG